MRRRFTDEQEAEISRRYEEGVSIGALARAYAASAQTITSALQRQGVPRRSLQEAIHLAHGMEGTPSPARLREVYLGREKPSTPMLALRFGVSPATISRWLKDAGVKIRSNSEQATANLKLARQSSAFARQSPEGRERFLTHLARLSANRSPEQNRKLAEAGNRPEVRAKIAATQRRRVVRPCGWCGAPVERIQSRADKCSASFCSFPESSQWKSHRRYHPNKPRPVIMERLWEAVGTSQSTKELLRAGEPIGATDTEYVAVVLVWVEQLKKHLETSPKVTARDMTLKLTPEAERLKVLVAWLAEA